MTSEHFFKEATALHQQRRLLEAEQRYREFLQSAPSHPEALRLLGWLHLQRGQPLEAAKLLRKSLKHNPQSPAAHSNLAQAMQSLGQHVAAIPHFDYALTCTPEDSSLRKQRFTSAWRALYAVVLQCDWQNYDRLQRIVKQEVMAEDDTNWVVGEVILANPAFNNHLIMELAKRHALHVTHDIKNSNFGNFAYKLPGRKLRIGYVGPDFFQQATAYLLTGVIEAHDRKHFEIFAYDHGSSAPSPMRTRCELAYDHMICIHDLSDDEAAQRIHADGIDILLSVSCPNKARLGIFARRPSAIQVHYLYFPATSGMPFFDFIVADDYIIPPEHEEFYTEKVLRLADCYQPNDSARPIAKDSLRLAFGISDESIVLANMGQAYKITPDIFDVWCKLLRADPRRILWLLSDDPIVKNNLRREATARGVEHGRLIFASLANTETHLARLRCSDIILDTFPYGGHTLTSDALWAGTPVVTMNGTTFASRVAGSLLRSVGLTKLIATTTDSYFSIADTLARSPDERLQLRQFLDDNRHQFDLFNSAKYAKKLEGMYVRVIQQRWKNWEFGQPVF